MKIKLITAVLVTAFCVAAAPLALEQLSRLPYLAKKWTRNTLLSSVVVAHASEREPDAGEALATDAPGNQGATASSNEFRWSGRIASGNTIEIKGVNGNVTAEPSDGGEVEVTATKTGRRSNPKDVEIRVVEHGGGVTICAVYPSTSSRRLNQCEPGEGGHMSVHDNDVEVAFKVRVPRGVRFSGQTVNGGVETGALGGDVDARTVNGSIRVSAAGVATAQTVNGSITASLGRADWSGSVEFKTVNGAITLDLPSDTNAEVEAETLNGDITSDFPMTLLGRISRRHLNGTIGSGGRELSIKTVNGSIRLRRTS